MNAFVFFVEAFNTKQSNCVENGCDREEEILVKIPFTPNCIHGQDRENLGNITWVVFGTANGMRKWLRRRRKQFGVMVLDKFVQIIGCEPLSNGSNQLILHH